MGNGSSRRNVTGDEPPSFSQLDHKDIFVGNRPATNVDPEVLRRAPGSPRQWGNTTDQVATTPVSHYLEQDAAPVPYALDGVEDDGFFDPSTSRERYREAPSRAQRNYANTGEKMAASATMMRPAQSPFALANPDTNHPMQPDPGDGVYQRETIDMSAAPALAQDDTDHGRPSDVSAYSKTTVAAYDRRQSNTSAYSKTTVAMAPPDAVEPGFWAEFAATARESIRSSISSLSNLISRDDRPAPTAPPRLQPQPGPRRRASSASALSLSAPDHAPRNAPTLPAAPDHAPRRVPQLHVVPVQQRTPTSGAGAVRSRNGSSGSGSGSGTSSFMRRGSAQRRGRGNSAQRRGRGSTESRGRAPRRAASRESRGRVAGSSARAAVASMSPERPASPRHSRKPGGHTRLGGSRGNRRHDGSTPPPRPASPPPRRARAVSPASRSGNSSSARAAAVRAIGPAGTLPRGGSLRRGALQGTQAPRL